MKILDFCKSYGNNESITGSSGDFDVNFEVFSVEPKSRIVVLFVVNYKDSNFYHSFILFAA